MSCNACGAWWLPGGKRCPAHEENGAPLPEHSLSESRKTFPALSEDVRAFYRVNGNLARDVPDGPPLAVPESLTRVRGNEPRPRRR